MRVPARKEAGYFAAPRDDWPILMPTRRHASLCQALNASEVQVRHRGPGGGRALRPWFGHGVWAPLRRSYPLTDIPVIPLSLDPQAGAAQPHRIGRAAAGRVCVDRPGWFCHDQGELDHEGAKRGAGVGRRVQVMDVRPVAGTGHRRPARLGKSGAACAPGASAHRAPDAAVRSLGRGRIAPMSPVPSRWMASRSIPRCLARNEISVKSSTSKIHSADIGFRIGTVTHLPAASPGWEPARARNPAAFAPGHKARRRAAALPNTPCRIAMSPFTRQHPGSRRNGARSVA